MMTNQLLQEEREMRTVALYCRTCGKLHNHPLTIYDEGSFGGAVVAAYTDEICQYKQIPIPGVKLEITVIAPFCCTVGNSFWFTDSSWFVQAKMISVLSMDEHQATILAEILQTKDRLAFVQPVPEEEKKRLSEQHCYNYDAPSGDAPTPQFIEENAGILHLYNGYGGGDIDFDDYIYTDPDGIDHLILKEYSDFEGTYSFVGDEILGFHADSPYQWENGLLIDWKSKTVIGCLDDATEVVIPQGIVRLGWGVFKWRSRLEKITIPDTVTGIYYAFLKKPKEVILTGNSPLTEKDLSEFRGAQIHRIP